MLVPFKERPAGEVLGRYRQNQGDDYDCHYLENPQKPVPSAVHIFAPAASLVPNRPLHNPFDSIIFPDSQQEVFTGR